MTDGERCEVAVKLRELPIDMYEVAKSWESEGISTGGSDQTDYYLIHFALFGCLPADHMHPCDYEELHARLADLIEPEERTCRNIAKKSDREFWNPFVCSECGADPHDAESYYCGFSSGEYDWRFCPNCGAKVVEQ